MVVRAQKTGTRLLPILIGTPRFLAPCGSRSCSVRLPVYKQKQRNAWQDFLQAAVARYEPGGVFWQQHPFLLPQNPITDWQIWNEENNDNVHAKPKDYAKLVEISDEAIKATDPSANLVLGGLAGNVSSGHPHPTAQAYLDDLYKFVPKSSFDEVALHPYAQKVSDVAGEIKGVRRAMQKHHDANRRLLITEIGWGSGAPKEQHDFVLTPKGQKQRLLAVVQAPPRTPLPVASRRRLLVRLEGPRARQGPVRLLLLVGPPEAQRCGEALVRGLQALRQPMTDAGPRRP